MDEKTETDVPIAPVARLPWLLVLLMVAAMAVAWRVALAWQGVDLFSDDAYYYAVIARNFVETGRITFDGTSLTSGFHPLLFWLEAAGMAVFGADATPTGQYLGIFVGVMTVFLLTVAGCLFTVHRRPSTEDDAVMQCSLLLAICAILAPRFTGAYLGGMEAILVLPLLILFGLLAWKTRYAAAAVAALFLVMARLDTLPYIVFPVAMACAWRGRPWRRHARHRPAIGDGLLLVSPAVIGTLIFMLFNRWYFGHPMPIHGVLKSCFPHVNFQWRQVFAVSSDSVTLMFAFAAAVAAMALLLRSGNVGKEVRAAGMVAAALGLIQLAAFMLFQKWTKPIPAWYVGPAVLSSTFALAVAVGNTIGLRRLRTLATLAIMAVVAVNLASVTRAWHRGLPDDGAGLIDFMKTQPGDSIWACTDCGKLAFWSGRRVVNLDGLVNDFHYQDTLREKRLARYLSERKVRYLVFLAWDRPQREGGQYEPMYECRVAPGLFAGEYEAVEYYVYSYKYMDYSDRIRLPRSAEVWRSTALRDGRALGKTIVFDLENLPPRGRAKRGLATVQ